MRSSCIDPAGQLVDSATFQVAAAAVTGGPFISSNGEDSLVMWGTVVPGEIYVPAVFGILVSADGTTIDLARPRIADWAYPAAVTTDGAADYLAISRGVPVPYAVSARGVVSPQSIDPVVLGSSIGGSTLAAFDGADYLVLWQGGAQSPSILGARVAKDHTLIDAQPFQVGAGSLAAGALVFQGPDDLAVWGNQSGIDGEVHVATISTDAVVTGDAGLPLVASGSGAAAAVNSRHEVAVACTGKFARSMIRQRFPFRPDAFTSDSSCTATLAGVVNGCHGCHCHERPPSRDAWLVIMGTPFKWLPMGHRFRTLFSPWSESASTCCCAPASWSTPAGKPPLLPLSATVTLAAGW